jgi:hypothetical protein
VASEDHLQRVRKFCTALPGTTEKISHGEPTFFANKKVFCMFSNNHHGDGHIAVWIPAAPGAQATLIQTWPKTFYYPPYVGVKGWVGIELATIDDEDLGAHLTEAWNLISAKKPSGRNKSQ